MSWPTVTLILGILAFVGVLVSWCGYVLALVTKKDPGIPDPRAWDMKSIGVTTSSARSRSTDRKEQP